MLSRLLKLALALCRQIALEGLCSLQRGSRLALISHNRPAIDVDKSFKSFIKCGRVAKLIAVHHRH